MLRFLMFMTMVVLIMLYVKPESILIATLAIVFASVAEYVIHRYIMHTSWYLSAKAYLSHHVKHHGMYGSGETYHAHSDGHRDPDHKHIDMAWWHRFIIVLPAWAVFATGVWIFLFVTGSEIQPGTWQLVLWESLIIFWLNYETYDYFHRCMHTPTGRWFETTELYAFLNRHHNLHHAYPLECNWNTIVVFADVLFRTQRTTHKRDRVQPGVPVPVIRTES